MTLSKINSEQFNGAAQTAVMELGMAPSGLPAPVLSYKSVLSFVNEAEIEERLKQFKRLREFVMRIKDEYMDEGHHYGTVKGIDRPMLFKPGAEILASGLNLMPDPDTRFLIVQQIGDMVNVWARVFIREMSTGHIVYQDIGACSSYEKKYRLRWHKRSTGVKAPYDYTKARKAGMEDEAKRILISQLGTAYDPEMRYTTAPVDGTWMFHELFQDINEHPYDQFNTWIKMAVKRGFVGAVIGVTGSSDIWTVEGEDTREVLVSRHLKDAIKAMCSLLQWKDADLLKLAHEHLNSTAKTIDEFTDHDAIQVIRALSARIEKQKANGGNGGNGGPKTPQPAAKPLAPEPKPPSEPTPAESRPEAPEAPQSAEPQRPTANGQRPTTSAEPPRRISEEKLKLVEAKLTVKGYTLDDANKVLSNLRSSTHQKFGVESVQELSDEIAEEFIHGWISKQPNKINPRKRTRQPDNPEEESAKDEGGRMKDEGKLGTLGPAPNPQSPIPNPQSPMLRTEPRSDSPQITEGTLAAIKRVVDDKWIGQGEVTTAIAELYRVNRLEIMTEKQGGHFLKGWLESYTDGEEDKPATEFQLNKIEQLHKLLNLNADNR